MERIQKFKGKKGENKLNLTVFIATENFIKKL